MQPYLSFLLWTWNISISAYKLTNHKYVHFLFVCLRKWWNKWEGKVFQKKIYIYKQASLASLWTFSVFVDSLIKFSHAFNLSHFEAPQRSVKKKNLSFLLFVREGLNREFSSTVFHCNNFCLVRNQLLCMRSATIYISVSNFDSVSVGNFE